VTGIRDQRRGNTRLARRDEILALLPQLVERQPEDFGWCRSTWSVELVALEVERQLGVRVSRTHMGRLLRQAGCRRVRPKPTVRSDPAEKKRRLQELEARLAELNDEDIVLFADEVDIHLNPKIGPDWAPPGVRKEVVTPGQNKKHYLAGAFDRLTNELIVVDGPRKNSALFIELLDELARRFEGSWTVHLVVDNYIIHKSKITQKAVEKHGGKIVLHFLPPYSPDENPIERVWWNLHEHVTRNHRARTLEALLEQVMGYVKKYDGFGAHSASTRRRAA
jgi:transposase